jgi:predicted amidophosphoribosyltransferase
MTVIITPTDVRGAGSDDTSHVICRDPMMLLPRTCPLCRRPGAAPCAVCIGALERAPALAPPPGVDGCRAVLAYDGSGRELVARLKYRNARSSLRWLAAAMATLFDPAAIDAVTWVPTTSTRRQHRGFDQAELLARAVARHWHRPCVALLRRGPGPAQTGRTGPERRAGPVLAVARGRIPARIALIDDVVTTGTSVSTGARALRAAGATTVVVLAAARTPLKRPRRASETNMDGSD